MENQVTGATIQIQFGACGNRLGCQYLRTISDEHKIDLATGEYYGCASAVEEIFAETAFTLESSGVYRPKAILVHPDETILNEILNETKVNDLICKDQIVTIPTSTECGLEMAILESTFDGVIERVRKEIEICDSPNALQIFHSATGRFSSTHLPGFLSLLHGYYPKKFKSNILVIPDIEPDSIGGETFRSLGTFEELLNASNACLIYDNRAMTSIWHSLNVTDVTNCHLNRLAAAHIAGMTAAYRFPGCMNRKMSDLVRGLELLDGMHFFIPSVAPVYRLGRGVCGEENLFDFTRQIFEQSNMMVTLKDYGAPPFWYSAACVYRGDISPYEARWAIAELVKKRNGPFFFSPQYFHETAFVENSEGCGPEFLSALINSDAINGLMAQIATVCSANNGTAQSKFMAGKPSHEKLELKRQCEYIEKIADIYAKENLETLRNRRASTQYNSTVEDSDKPIKREPLDD